MLVSKAMGVRSNDLVRGADGALDERTVSLSGGTSIPLATVSGVFTRLSLNASIVDRDDPQNPVAGSRDLYLLGGLHGQTDDQESMGSLLLGFNTSELTGVVDSNTDIVRFAATTAA